MKKYVALPTLLLLAACAGGVRDGTPPAVYDFGMPVARIAAGESWSKLALEIKAPHWLDASGVGYRLAYEDPLKLRDYGGSRWAGAPALLLGQRLRQQLGVASVGGNMAADCLLRFELQEFSQVFDSPQQSRGVLQGSASLIDGKRQLLAERAITIAQPAATPDAHGGVAALVAAGNELGKQLSDWLAGLERSGRLAVCRSGKQEAK